MFKAVENLREQKGFTLIELLIVIAIIGILAAIAIPAFLGQREKAKQRSLESSARGMLSEVQSVIDDYVAGQPMIFLGDVSGTQLCFEKAGQTVAKYTCEVMYSDLSEYGTSYTSLSDVMTWLVAEHNTYKGELSPYTGQPLINIEPNQACDDTADTEPGLITICLPNQYTAVIAANASPAEEVEIYRTVVSAK